MQFLGEISKTTDWSLFISKANHSYHSNPSLCPDQYCWRSWSWTVLRRPTKPSRTNTQKRCPFHYRGLECKSRKSRDTWSNRQIWPWSTKRSRAKVNRVFPRELTGHSKNWCFWTAVLEKTLESPLDCKIKPVNPKGNQSWIFTGRADAEAETPILWPPDVKNRFIGKDPYVGKDWRKEEKGMTEDEMVEWHHQLDGCEYEPSPRVDDGQGLLQAQRVGHDWVTELNWKNKTN